MVLWAQAIIVVCYIVVLALWLNAHYGRNAERRTAIGALTSASDTIDQLNNRIGREMRGRLEAEQALARAEKRIAGLVEARDYFERRARAS